MNSLKREIFKYMIQAAEERRKVRETSQLAQLAEKKKRAEEVRAKKVINGDNLEEGDDS